MVEVAHPNAGANAQTPHTMLVYRPWTKKETESSAINSSHRGGPWGVHKSLRRDHIKFSFEWQWNASMSIQQQVAPYSRKFHWRQHPKWGFGNWHPTPGTSLMTTVWKDISQKDESSDHHSKPVCEPWDGEKQHSVLLHREQKKLCNFINPRISLSKNLRDKCQDSHQQQKEEICKHARHRI